MHRAGSAGPGLRFCVCRRADPLSGSKAARHVVGLRVGPNELLLRLTLDVKGADLNDPARMGGRALRGNKAFRFFASGAAAPGACGTTGAAAAEDIAGPSLRCVWNRLHAPPSSRS